jgi:hypothetical protein
MRADKKTTKPDKMIPTTEHTASADVLISRPLYNKESRD